MDGFDCLGATDTSDDFSSFLKKQGLNLMSATAEQLKTGDAKKPADDKKKKDAPGKSSSMVYPIGGAVVGLGAGAYLWRAHRVIGGLLGAVGGGALGRVVSMFV